MTDQEIFNTVVAHLKAQGKKCAVGEACRYRLDEVIEGVGTGRVLKCAAGALLPDNLYDPKMEGVSFGYDAVKPELFGVQGDAQRELVYELQQVHDDFEVAQWPDLLEALAARLNLRACLVVAWKAELREAAL